MTIKRLDHVSVVVDDLAAAMAFFTALGMTLEGKMPVEGPWVERVNGLQSVQVDAFALSWTTPWPLPYIAPKFFIADALPAAAACRNHS
jgi:catechol 2,3-dioxygenase-like lactoylglutathione lyase family enzyme